MHGKLKIYTYVNGIIWKDWYLYQTKEIVKPYLRLGSRKEESTTGSVDSIDSDASDGTDSCSEKGVDLSQLMDSVSIDENETSDSFH